jgi:hypothetical protein
LARGLRPPPAAAADFGNSAFLKLALSLPEGAQAKRVQRDEAFRVLLVVGPPASSSKVTILSE